MPPDRFVRSRRPLDPRNFGFARSLSRPYLRNDNTDGSDRLGAENISASPEGFTVMLAPATTIVSTSIASHECAVTLPPSQVGRSHATPVGIDLRLAPDLDRPQRSTYSQSSKSLMPPLQPHEDRPPIRHSLQHEFSNIDPYVTDHYASTSITHRRTQPLPAQSANQHRSVDSQYHVPYQGHDPGLEYPQARNDLQVEALLKQKCLTSRPSHQPSNATPFFAQATSSGLLNNAHDFVMHNPLFLDDGSDNFMASLLEQTIKGAEFDSSDRNMPLRCHPGTRLEIIKRCQDFVLSRKGRAKLRWVVGSAGVGKSAIMQSVAHDESDVLFDIIVGATIFFSINGRQDGSKAITTIAYQLAVKIDSYRCFIQLEVTRDPSLLRKSLARQFKKFIVEPFIDKSILDSHSRLLIIMDGLDECADIAVQKELLSLVA